MNTPAIRRATVADAAEIARLLALLGHPGVRAATAAQWSAWEAAGDLALVAAAADATLHGVATLHRMTVLHRPRPVGRITALIIDPAHRRRGLGRRLVTAAEMALREAGCGLVEITSNDAWGDAHAFYAHIGYERTSVRFAKTLTPPEPPVGS